MTKRLLAAAALLAPAAASAYLLSSSAIVHRMAVHRDEMGIWSLVARGTFAFEGEEARAVAAALGLPPSSQLQVPAVATYKMPGRCRIELEGPRDPPSVANVNGKLRAGGPDILSLRAFGSWACPVLFQRGGADEERGVAVLMRDLGIDPYVVNLGRVGGVVAYVLGARSRDTEVPSLWIDKDRFNPLRVVAKGSEAVWDLRFVDFSSPVAGEWHPRAVEIRKGAELVAKLLVERVEVNQKISDTAF